MLRAGGLTIEREICTAPCIVMAAVAEKNSRAKSISPPFHPSLLPQSHLQLPQNGFKSNLNSPLPGQAGDNSRFDLQGSTFSKPWLDIRTNSRRMM